jgi:hypothetical protein
VEKDEKAEGQKEKRDKLNPIALVPAPVYSILAFARRKDFDKSLARHLFKLASIYLTTEKIIPMRQWTLRIHFPRVRGRG